MTHTTFVPYREFEKVLSIKGIDEYIRYGGTISLGGINYNHILGLKQKHTSYNVDKGLFLSIWYVSECQQGG